MEAFASKLPSSLHHFKFVTTLENGEDFSGLKKLVSSLPRELKEFSLVFESWESFRSNYFCEIVEDLPADLEKLSLIQYGGHYINEDDMIILAEKMSKQCVQLKEFFLYTRSNAEEVGHYQIRDIKSVDQLYSIINVAISN